MSELLCNSLYHIIVLGEGKPWEEEGVGMWGRREEKERKRKEGGDVGGKRRTKINTYPHFREQSLKLNIFIWMCQVMYHSCKPCMFNEMISGKSHQHFVPHMNDDCAISVSPDKSTHSSD